MVATGSFTYQTTHTFNSLEAPSRYDIVKTSPEVFCNETKDTTPTMITPFLPMGHFNRALSQQLGRSTLELNSTIGKECASSSPMSPKGGE